MAITVYSKPHCPKCDSTYRELDSKGIEYEVVDMMADVKTFEFVTQHLGYLEAPVVFVTEDEHWSGFKADKIKELAKRFAT